MASYDVTALDTAFQFDAGDNYYNASCLMDATHVLNVWADASDVGTAQIFSVDTGTGEMTQIGTAFTTFDIGWSDVIKIDDTHALWVQQRTTGALYFQVLAINTTTWAVTLAASSDPSLGGEPSAPVKVEQVDSTHFLVTWAESSLDGFAQIFTVNTGTWAVTAEGSTLEFADSVTITDMDLIMVSSDDAIVAYRNSAGGTSAANVLMLAVNTGTWAVTVPGSPFVYDASSGVGQGPSLVYFDSTHAIICYAGSGLDGFALALAFNTGTGGISAAGSAFEFDTAQGTWNSAQLVDSTHVINMWQGLAGDGYIQVLTVNTGTWAITANGTAVEFDATDCEATSLVKIDDDLYVGFWSRDGANEGYVQAFGVELASATARSFGFIF